MGGISLSNMNSLIFQNKIFYKGARWDLHEKKTKSLKIESIGDVQSCFI